jgi:hypothetical protein
VRPLLRSYTDGADDEPLVIETELTDEERCWVAEGMKEYEEHPENFTSWADMKKELGLV